jgi:hypothetical protein
MPTAPADFNNNIILPQGDLNAIGWRGAIERDDAAALLKGMPVGTFLTRWSTRNRCYVVSYVKVDNPNSNNNNNIRHVGYIEPCDGLSTVRKADGSNMEEKSLHENVGVLQGGNVISNPYSTNDGELMYDYPDAT